MTSKIDKQLEAPAKHLRARSMPLSIAAVLLVVFIGGTMWYYYANYSTQAIFRTCYVEDPGLPVLISGDGSKNFDEAMSLYKLKKYNASIAILNELSKTDPANDTLLYYSGVNLLMMEKADAAEIFLKHVYEMPDSEFQEDAEYRYAVSLWLTGKHEQAIILLNSISNDKNSKYQESAVELVSRVYLTK